MTPMKMKVYQMQKSEISQEIKKETALNIVSILLFGRKY